jgi:hypothetical protein
MSHIICSLYLFFDKREKVWKGISLINTAQQRKIIKRITNHDKNQHFLDLSCNKTEQFQRARKNEKTKKSLRCL